MTDYYFAANSAEALIAALSPPDPAPRFRFQATFANVLDIKQGRAAVAEFTDEDGNAIPAQPAIGDPNKFYTCIRSPEAITAPEGVEAVEPEIGIVVCGSYA